MKKIILAFLCAICLLSGGCSSKEKKAGEVVQITLDEVKQKVDKKESFAVIFTQPTCAYCKRVMTMLESYLPDHTMTLYDVVLDVSKLDETQVNELLIDIHSYFPEMNGTPDLYYVKEGAIVDRFDADNEKMDDEKVFDTWAQKYHLVK